MQKILEKLRRQEQVTIVALGDSNTELTWHTFGRLNWVGLLQEALFQKYGPNLAFTINAGRCGGGAADALSRLESDVIRFAPDLVIIAFGMNDAAQGEAGLPLFAQSTAAIVAQLRERCDGEILLRTPNPIVVSNQPGLPPDHRIGEPWPGQWHHLYARCLVELAAELNCSVVDHYSLWTEAERVCPGPQDPNHLWLRMSDSIHPNALGHLYFYREMALLFDLPTRFVWE